MYNKTKDVLHALETVKKYCTERQCCNCEIVIFCDEYLNGCRPPNTWYVKDNDFKDIKEDV